MGSIWLMVKQRGLEMQLAIICMIFIMTISVRAQTTKSTVCEDAIGAEKCAKRQGNCQKERVKLDCQLTCGECTPANITTVAPTSNTTTPKTVCEDAIGAEKCAKRTAKKENVKLDCQLTCGECTPANITTLPPTNTTTLAPTSNTTTPTNGDCVDKKDQEICQNKKDKGKCDDFMDDCALTCGFCGTNTTTTSNGDCLDKKGQEFCEMKRDKGKCANFMDDCALTCGFCGTNTTTPSNGDCLDKKGQEFCE